MDVKEAIEKRRAYRSLDFVEISDELIYNLANSAILAPSCFNNQPERFIFVKNKEKLNELFSSLSKNNDWAKDASMIIVVYSKKDFDCDIKGREYYLFDTGLAVAFLILRATELGLVAHPIAGYDEDKVKEIFNLDSDTRVITLIVIGKHSKVLKDVLTDKQKAQEIERPKRKDFHEFSLII